MLGLQTHSEETGCEIAEAGEADYCSEEEGRLEWAVAVQDVIEHAVSEDLEALGVAYGAFTIVLDSLKVVNGD